MGRFAAFAWSTVGLFRKNLRFRVTSKDTLSATQTAARVMSPQILVSGLNILAIGVGILLWTFGRHLPIDGLIANIVWASVNFTMAFLIVKFTLLRTKFKRKEYRFPVPLPAYVAFGDDAQIMMTVDDISSSGCRLYGRLPASAQLGDLLHGELLMPGEALPFTAWIAALIPGESAGEHYTKAIGLAFQWQDNKDRDQLDLFLYGSDLQWQLHGLNDRVRTPTEVIQQRLSGQQAQDDSTWTPGPPWNFRVASRPPNPACSVGLTARRRCASSPASGVSMATTRCPCANSPGAARTWLFCAQPAAWPKSARRPACST